MIDPGRLYDICEAMREAVIDYYGAAPDATPLPARTFTAYSAAAVADDCEQFVVAPENTRGYEASLAFQTFENQTKAAAHAMRNGTFSLMLTRCITAKSNGSSTSTDAEDEDAQMILSDAGHMLNALVAAEKAGDLAGCKGVAFLDWRAPEVEGAMATGVLRVAVSLLRIT